LEWVNNTPPIPARIYGNGYQFTLPDAVNGVVEYVIDLRNLESLAREYNLQLQFVLPFAEFYQRYAMNPTYLRLLQDMRVIHPHTGQLQMSHAEWNVCQLYVAVLFVKVT
jgi:hypothetical protein